MLSNSAFNAFLKTLEEPPSYAKFILATTEKHKILPTILSRCQKFDFNRIQLQDIVDHLAKVAQKENIEAEPEALALVAQKADGGMRDALSIFDLLATFGGGKTITYENAVNNLHILDYDYYFRVQEHLLAQEAAKVLLIFDEVLRKGFDGHNFLNGLASHLRNLLVCKDPETVKLLEVSATVQQKYLQQARLVETHYILTALNHLNQTEVQYKSSKNQRLLVELLLIKLAHLPSVFKLASLPLDAGEKKNNAA